MVFFLGMAFTGVRVYNADQQAHGGSAVSLAGYLTSGDFLEATFENWESEFLQMGMYVVLTASLVQRGSSESKPIPWPAPQDADPRQASRAGAPWPVRRGGWVLKMYKNSLASLFFLLFFGSVALHAVGGAEACSSDQAAHGEPGVTVWQYLGTSQSWFESMQNWQSEFLAVGTIVGASVYASAWVGGVQASSRPTRHDRRLTHPAWAGADPSWLLNPDRRISEVPDPVSNIAGTDIVRHATGPQRSQAVAMRVR